MIQVTASVFRKQQGALFAAADQGETVIITRKGKPSYVLIQVSDDDFSITPELQKRIDEARAEIAKGNCVVCKTEKELHDYLDSL
jgi:PHD/YefM family antitoxin component YafN of YafNO toxin-antitoxin module